MIAREYGFSSWPRLKEHAEGTYGDLSQRIDHFLRWACSTEARGPDGGHLARAKAALAESPELAAVDISIQIALGDAEAVRKAIETDPDFARSACGLREWIPLPYSVHSCFHTDPQYADGIAECAQLLLDLGADPNAGTSSMGTDRSESEFPILLSAIERTRNVHFVEQLLIAGADPVTTGAYYNTWTCTDTAIPELLYAHGAPVNGLEFEMHCPGILQSIDCVRTRTILRAWGGFSSAAQIPIFATLVHVIASLFTARLNTLRPQSCGFSSITERIRRSKTTTAGLRSGWR